MPKKKKKVSTGNNNTPASSKKQIVPEQLQSIGQDELIVDVLKVQLASSKSSSGAHVGPARILMCEDDAYQLDVLADDDIIVLAENAENTPITSIIGAVVGTAQILVGNDTISRKNSPMSPRSPLGQKKNPVVPGTIQILPSSVADDFLINSMASASNPAMETPSRTQIPETPPKPPPKATPSSASSAFSFKIGGGGDKLYSSPTPVAKRQATPSKGGNRNKQNCWLIPMRNAIGRTLSQKLCYDCSHIYLVPAEPENSTIDKIMNSYSSLTAFPSQQAANQKILKRLVLAHCVRRYCQVNEVLRISFQGQTVALRVKEATGTNNNDMQKVDSLLEDFNKKLSLNETTNVQSGRGRDSTDDSTSGAEVQLVNEFDKKLLIRDQNNAAELSEENEALLKAAENSLRENSIRLYKISYETKITFSTADGHGNEKEESYCNSSTIQNKSEKDQLTQRQYVAGLSSTLTEVRSLLETPLLHSKLFEDRGMKAPRGVLLHGASGVGKSSLARQMAHEFSIKHPSCHVEHINCASLQSKTLIVGEAERRVSELFQIPNHCHNKLLILDDVHLICARRGSAGNSNQGTDRLAATLLALVDGIASSSSTRDANRGNLVILAITTNPSMLDPALRRPGRLDTEVEVPIPDDASTRSEILRFHLDNFGVRLLNIKDDDWLGLAKLAKGFNGADCMLAVKEAVRRSVLRGQSNYNNRTYLNDSSPGKKPIEMVLTDLKAAIRTVKPSAIKSITVEIPKVYWSSIGGMDSVKSELREAIELPLTHGEFFEQHRVPPPRGILLFGPPGCSKTLCARALATESEMNFLAVKGPELLSKWLGESERALASLFRRARMASPAIIFFDEIDAIACKRGGGDSAASSRLLSQLLTELDGVNNTGSAAGNSKQRVVVVGATNRPDLLDSALTRPGRIDRKIFVGPPDAASRSVILTLSLHDRSCADDVDIDFLASDELTKGFSGAEIVAICRDAALLALEESDDLNSGNMPMISMRHLIAAVKGMKRQITPEMLDFYESYLQ